MSTPPSPQSPDSAHGALDHDPIQGVIIHEYDGIREADNFLPRWWLWTLHGAVVFSLAYWFYFHTAEIGDSPQVKYVAALEARAAQQGTVSPEFLESLAQNPDVLAEGKVLYASNCAVCHHENGSGGIGPNLTDAYWLHGGDPASIYHVIAEGVSDKGMPAWGATLGPKASQRVTAYVLTMRGKNIPGKEPQGVSADAPPGSPDDAPADEPRAEDEAS